tara:strand:- start:561 stop:1250 length:690 start_codon:yes stop_codon:yes gene_type:complete
VVLHKKNSGFIFLQKFPTPISGKKTLIYFRIMARYMAKGSRDLILRDRLQFTLDGSGDAALVYGRVDLSDFVNVVKREGMAVKEIRYMLRAPAKPNGVLSPLLLDTVVAPTTYRASIKVFASTTAYENIEDVGIASPDVISILEMTSSITGDATGTAVGTVSNQWVHWGTPDLHPEGYNVVSDLLIGVGAQEVAAQAGGTLEIDIMVIGEPVKLNEADMTEMLTQQQDL